MLERNWPQSARDWQESDQRQEFVTLSDILAFVRHYFFSIVAFAVIGVLGALAFLVTSNPIYSAQTQVLIEPKLPQNLQQQPAEVNLSLDTAQIESEMAVMRSEKIALMVIKNLDLANDPTYMSAGGLTMTERARRLERVFFPSAGADATTGRLYLPPMEELSKNAAARRLQDAVAIFRGSLTVEREGVSYAIDIAFQALSPVLAAKIANEVANAYVQEQQDMQSTAATEASDWLERRIREVGKQMNAATRLLQEFRAKHSYGLNEEMVIDDTVGILGGPNTEHKVTLEQLQASEDTYRKIYEGLLGAYTASVDRQPYVFANARVITSARDPRVETRPLKKLIIAFGLLVGMVIGIGIAIARRSLDVSVRNAAQIRSETGLPCICELPVVRFRRRGFGRLNEVLRRPKSLFAWNLRSARLAIDLAGAAGKSRFVGVTSVSPGDGKGTVVSNLAALYAAGGAKTLVVSSDLRSCLPTAAAKAAAPAPAKGDETEEKADALADRIVHSADGKFDVLPGEKGPESDFLVAGNLKRIVEEGVDYDVVLVDLPAYSSGPDSLAVCSLLDSVVVVSDCGRTSLSTLTELVQTLRSAKANVLGVLMTRVRSVSTRGHRRLARQAPR